MPVLVAESFERVVHPLETMLRPARRGSPAAVAGQIAAGLARPVDPRPMPEWLRPEQRAQCARLLPVLRQYGGALLADPVGSGKTWIALAAATFWADASSRAIALVPAAIVPQWRRTAELAGVGITIWSHENVSRGNLPPGLREPGSPLVVIDESHRFRNRETIRYRTIAPYLAGKPVLLLTATPVVNGLSDLAAQLALGIRDDALAPFGVASIRHHLLTDSKASPALGEFLLTRDTKIHGKPEKVQRKAGVTAPDAELESRCVQLEQLALSVHPPTMALVRTVLWRALASSDLALLAVLRRYQSLLLHARDARAAGKSLGRAALRSFLAGDDQQLIMWEMIAPVPSAHDLVLEDLPLVASLINDARCRARLRDAKSARLAHLLRTGQPAIVFAGARETVRYLSGQLPDAAWCTGEAAGIGFTRMEREAVLSWFRPTAPSGGPATLIATDVAAEGLDLQRAGRIIHYDLPWTAVRMDQRDGRALRLGSRHQSVEVIRFELPPPIERRLGQLRLVARKRRLPRQAGIDLHGARRWIWREGLALQYPGMTGSELGWFCQVTSDENGLLAGFLLSGVEPGGRRRRLAAIAGFLAPDGTWSEEPEVIDRWMAAAVTGLAQPGSESCIQSYLAQLAGIVAERLRSFERARWSRPVSPLQSRIITRLNRLATRAARSRDSRRLQQIERAIAFAGRGHTAGEEFWLEKLDGSPDPALLREIRRCPDPEAVSHPVFCELLGAVVFARSKPDYPSVHAPTDYAVVRP